MSASNGKIARFPDELREELNQRLADGESGCQLVNWLNTLPTVHAILDTHFEGRPIYQNLSERRQGGYAEW